MNPHVTARRLMIALLASALSAAALEARPLSLQERIAAQRSIEQVYWNHRIWPKENQEPKPPLSATLPEAAIRARVEDSLRKSNALEKYWHRPITAEQLQAELNRIAAHTRDPEVLRELFAALGNDPRIIAETLVRQTLADRLIRNWYANDARFHGDLRKKAEAALAACQSVECLPSMGGEYREITVQDETLRTGRAESTRRGSVVRLDSEQWNDQREPLVALLGASERSLPVRTLSGMEDTTEAFVVTAVLSQDEGEIRTATVTWPKRSFDAWWADVRFSLVNRVEDAPDAFTLPADLSPACVADTWEPTFQTPPMARAGHTAVWTGAEMIVWGGNAYGAYLSSGGRYSPSIDTWSPTTGANVPAGRTDHTAVWTGTEMIVWGGSNGGLLNTGGRYDPSTDTWLPTSMTDVPAARRWHTAVWTGTQMIVWGGLDLISGGRYHASSDTWTATSIANAPVSRAQHSAIWTGTDMIVWGGNDGVSAGLRTGGRYHPFTDTWMPTTTVNAPSLRAAHTAVWTGTQMIIWGGGAASTLLNTGGRYNPTTDSWTPTSTGANVPAARALHTAAWTGTEMILWGGVGHGAFLNTGSRYDPTNDAWTPTSTGANVPSVRGFQTVVWTGTEMIVWGGNDGIAPMGTGGRYDPSTDAWLAVSSVAFPPVGSNHTAVWTGTEMIVWGGASLSNSAYRYDPSLDAWIPTSTGTTAPTARILHTGVWTGREMIVWGGWDGTYMNTGGRYDPSTDTWTPTATGANVPSARADHTAVWSGTEMIVWGGDAGGAGLDTGGRYDPSTDTWMTTSTGANVPSGRFLHTAVWTGAEMIVWGGNSASFFQNTGGRYNPATDTWTPTSSGANLPYARWTHTAVWTGTEMIVWGGYGEVCELECCFEFCEVPECVNCYLTFLGDGGRYDPSSDTWGATGGILSGRYHHTALWTGREMIVWGGLDAVSQSTGARYDSSTGNWAPTSMGENLPAARFGHTAVWTGTRMIVWGGGMNTGGLYCACPSGTLTYRDADGDGYGDPALVGTSCDGLVPPGSVTNDLDCDDTRASVHPGALEICDGLDDDCDGTVDDAAVPGAVSSDTLSDAMTVAWSAVATARTYDVVFGDIGLLRASGGDFTAATQGCLAAHTSGTSANAGAVPAVGSALWIVVRADNCAGNGTYDSGGPGQVGSRDAEIDASPLTCSPAYCGDYVCNCGEDCHTCDFDCGVCPCVTDNDCQPATCCYAISCIPVWVPQGCGYPTCDDTGPFINCLCQEGTCVGVF